MRRDVALAAGLLSLAVTLLRAEERRLPLSEALALAERQNPELRALRERAEAESARAEAAGRTRLPRVTLSSSWSRTDNAAYVFAHKLNAGEFTLEDFAVDRLNDPGSISHLTTTAGVEVPLDVFGKIGEQARSQEALGRAAFGLSREAGLEVRLRVVEAYRRAGLARRSVEVTERALAGARAREADVQARVEEGATLNADLLRARARRRQREADLADRRGDAAVAAALLSRLLGTEPGTTIVPVDVPGPPPPLVGDEASWTARGLEARPAVAVARERVEAARRSARLLGHGLLPDLVAHGQLQDDRNAVQGGAQSYLVGVTLRWSPFDPVRSRREAAAAVDLRAAEEEARATTDQVRLEVASAYRRAQAARDRHEAAAGGAEEGREALRVIQERRRVGIATLTDELETEAASLSAQLEDIRAAAEASIADSALERAAGIGNLPPARGEGQDRP
jgi:outer membrane protein TolC